MTNLSRDSRIISSISQEMTARINFCETHGNGFITVGEGEPGCCEGCVIHKHGEIKITNKAEFKSPADKDLCYFFDYGVYESGWHPDYYKLDIVTPDGDFVDDDIVKKIVKLFDYMDKPTTMRNEEDPSDE